MVEVRPDEVSAILRQQLSGFKSEAELEEVGTVGVIAAVVPEEVAGELEEVCAVSLLALWLLLVCSRAQ